MKPLILILTLSSLLQISQERFYKFNRPNEIANIKNENGADIKYDKNGNIFYCSSTDGLFIEEKNNNENIFKNITEVKDINDQNVTKIPNDGNSIFSSNTGELIAYSTKSDGLYLLQKNDNDLLKVNIESQTYSLLQHFTGISNEHGKLGQSISIWQSLEDINIYRLAYATNDGGLFIGKYDKNEDTSPVWTRESAQTQSIISPDTGTSVTFDSLGNIGYITNTTTSDFKSGLYYGKFENNNYNFSYLGPANLENATFLSIVFDSKNNIILSTSVNVFFGKKK